MWSISTYFHDASLHIYLNVMIFVMEDFDMYGNTSKQRLGTQLHDNARIEKRCTCLKLLFAIAQNVNQAVA